MTIVNLTLVSTAAKRRVLKLMQAGDITQGEAIRQLEALSLVGLGRKPAPVETPTIESLSHAVPNGWGWREQA